MYGGGVAKSMEMLAHRSSGSLDMARTGYQVSATSARMALMPDDSPTR
jgi:hypothetical protein